MDVNNVGKWCREFTAGRSDIHDEEGSGQTSTYDETIVKIKAAMLENQRMTIEELVFLVPEIFPATIHRILTDRLQNHKVCTRWVSRMLKNHKQRRVQSSMCPWKMDYPGSSPYTAVIAKSQECKNEVL